MKTNIATTSEQSSRLLRCGVSADTADMFYKPCVVMVEQDYMKLILFARNELTVGDMPTYPAWSLSSLLGLLPKTIGGFWMTKWYAPNVDGFEIDDMENSYQLSGDFQLLHIGGGNYQVEYDWDGFRGKLPQSDNPIEACVLAIELLTANGYNLNEQ